MVHTDKRRGKTHARLLYWFRTPPGVRVGRAPLDEDAIRLIEASNPSVEFDWPHILKGPEIVPPPRSPAPVERRARPRLREVPRLDPSPVPASGPAATPLGSPDIALPAAAAEPPAAGDAPELPVLAGSMAASARLGAEGLSRLRARHAEVLARITEKVEDPGRREQLKGDAERLNPDTWVTDDDVAAGLEGYESVFETLRGVIGHSHRRRRARGGARTTTQADVSSTAPTEPDEPSGDL